MLIIREEGSNRFKQKIATYKCHCGVLFTTAMYKIRLGFTKSCGCLQKKAALRNLAKATAKNRKIPGTSSANEVLKQYRYDAKRRQLEWELEREYAVYLMSQVCFYCGSYPGRINKTRSGDLFTYSGIDRVDNDLGYIMGNCVSCCTYCNLVKRDNDVQSFINWLDQVASYRKI